MKIAIVGAGVAGLASIRHALEYNVDCVAFEITEYIGGTWVYQENDKNNVQDELVPTAMYYNLRTNLPNCLMEFRGYKFQPKSGRCFPSRTEVLEYIEDFARDFNLVAYVKFSHKVTNISRLNDRWIVTVKNLKTDQYSRQEFDAVMVCSGHFSVPNYPNYPGMDTFPGHNIHSCYYKKNDYYEDKVVLMMGCGPTALDLSRDIAEVAFKVFLSHTGELMNFRQKNIIQKPRITKMDKNAIHFEDGTIEHVDAIVYCTGYKYEFPFLDPSCEITSENMILSPLYKYFINAKHPTMCINGLLQKSILFQLIDLQAEVFIKLVTGNAELPSKDKMLEDARKDYDEKIRSNSIGNHFYYLRGKMRKYFSDLCELGHCKPYPPVLFDVYDRNSATMANDCDSRRKQIYEIIDDNSYILRWEMENSST